MSQYCAGYKEVTQETYGEIGGLTLSTESLLKSSKLQECFFRALGKHKERVPGEEVSEYCPHRGHSKCLTGSLSWGLGQVRKNHPLIITITCKMRLACLGTANVLVRA